MGSYDKPSRDESSSKAPRGGKITLLVLVALVVIFIVISIIATPGPGVD